MNETIRAYPLQWPAGWRRAQAALRRYGRFGRHDTSVGYSRKKDITVSDAIGRVLSELQKLGINRDDVVISTNMPTRLDGLPRSDARNPTDPGAAVYWREWNNKPRCMAIDSYTTVADNLAAIAATLEAMRAIERHGGNVILDRVFEGFTALPSPEIWWQVLGLDGADATRDQIDQAYRRAISKAHPDNGGSDDQAARVNRAREVGLEICQS